MAITSPIYDPKSTATQLATISIQDRQSQLTLQNSIAGETDKALTSLKSAMSAFENAMSAISAKKTVLATTATFNSTVGTATASATATAGSYSFFVEKLATANQAQYSGISDVTPMSEAGTVAGIVHDAVAIAFTPRVARFAVRKPAGCPDAVRDGFGKWRRCVSCSPRVTEDDP